MLKPTVASELGRIQVALARQTVECPGEYHHLVGEGKSCCLALITRAPILDCGGTGFIPNPAFAGLLALVQSPCPIGCPNSILAQELCQQGLACDCNGSGHVLRTAFFETLFPGMAEGGLRQALIAIGELTSHQAEWDRRDAIGAIAELERLSGDHRVEALTAVATWLEGLAKEGHHA